jgi:hypothetical protein
MKKILILLFLSFSVHAQMPDVLSGLAIQGTLTNQSLKSVNQGMSSLKKNQILQDIQMVAMDIKTRYFGNYQIVSNSSVLYPVFQGLIYNIGHDNNSTFFIELVDINKDICQFLINSDASSIDVQINGNNNTSSCISNNTLKFIFD